MLCLLIPAVLIDAGIWNITSAERPADQYDASIPSFHADHDGMDDGSGTCTDAAGFALPGADCNLQDLVDQDIAEYPDEYACETPDRNIDFRRVRNLKVFFKNHSLSLTIDSMDLDAWQGGDIVNFEGRIGIVSDRRNRNGVPYVIHHNSPFRTA